MRNKNVQAEPYTMVPKVEDGMGFDAAIALHREAITAHRYWSDQKDASLSEKRAQQCLEMMHKWARVKSQASAIIQSYQLRMF